VNTPPQAILGGPQATSWTVRSLLTPVAKHHNTPNTLTYAWDFGDGSKGAGRTIGKTYQKAAPIKCAGG